MNLKELIFGEGVHTGGSGGVYRDSVQAWLPIKNIIGGVVITKDNRFVKIMEVLPVNIYLKSAIDRQNIISSFASYLQIAPDELQMIARTLPADTQAYADTMQAKAMKLMASKLAVAGIIEGTFSEEGLAAMSDVKDLTSQMAKELALGIRDNVEDIAAAFRKMAVMNPERKKNITAAQPKETAAEEQKAPAAKDSFGVRTAQAQVRQALYEGLLARTAEEQKKRKSKKAEVDENQLSIFGFAA